MKDYNEDFEEEEEEDLPIKEEEPEEETKEEKNNPLRNEQEDDFEEETEEDERDSHLRTRNFLILEDLKGGIKLSLGSDTDNVDYLMKSALWFKVNWFFNPEFNRENKEKGGNYCG